MSATAGVVVFALFVALSLLAATLGADSRDGADGSGALGRRRHHPQTWW